MKCTAFVYPFLNKTNSVVKGPFMKHSQVLASIILWLIHDRLVGSLIGGSAKCVVRSRGGWVSLSFMPRFQFRRVQLTVVILVRKLLFISALISGFFHSFQNGVVFWYCILWPCRFRRFLFNQGFRALLMMGFNGAFVFSVGVFCLMHRQACPIWCSISLCM